MPGCARAISPAGHVRALRRSGGPVALLAPERPNSSRRVAAPPINVDAAPTSRCTSAPPATGRSVRSPRSPGLYPSGLATGSARRYPPFHLARLRRRSPLWCFFVMTFCRVVWRVRRVRGLGGLAAARRWSMTSWSSRTAGRDPAASTSASASPIAHASTYKSSWSASSSSRAITNSFSLSSSSAARWRDTQSHCRHRWEQNCRGRPGPDRSGSTRLHHRHRRGSVMTKW